MTAWIVIADASTARIFQTSKRNDPLTLVHDFSHPDSREKTSDLVTDGQGRADRGPGTRTRSAMEPQTSPHEQEAHTFAHQLATTLAQAHARHAFDHLALIAPPHFLGLLRQSLSSEVTKLIKETQHHDLVKLTPQQLHDRLAPTIQALLRGEQDTSYP